MAEGSKMRKKARPARNKAAKAKALQEWGAEQAASAGNRPRRGAGADAQPAVSWLCEPARSPLGEGDAAPSALYSFDGAECAFPPEEGASFENAAMSPLCFDGSAYLPFGDAGARDPSTSDLDFDFDPPAPETSAAPLPQYLGEDVFLSFGDCAAPLPAEGAPIPSARDLCFAPPAPDLSFALSAPRSDGFALFDEEALSAPGLGDPFACAEGMPESSAAPHYSPTAQRRETSEGADERAKAAREDNSRRQRRHTARRRRKLFEGTAIGRMASALEQLTGLFREAGGRRLRVRRIEELARCGASLLLGAPAERLAREKARGAFGRYRDTADPRQGVTVTGDMMAKFCELALDERSWKHQRRWFSGFAPLVRFKNANGRLPSWAEMRGTRMRSALIHCRIGPYASIRTALLGMI